MITTKLLMTHPLLPLLGLKPFLVFYVYSRNRLFQHTRRQDKTSQLLYFSEKNRYWNRNIEFRGAGNPVNRNTSLIRSAFRPSDDATIYQFFIPGNAFMSVELKRTAKILNTLDHIELAKSYQHSVLILKMESFNMVRTTILNLVKYLRMKLMDMAVYL